MTFTVTFVNGVAATYSLPSRAHIRASGVLEIDALITIDGREAMRKEVYSPSGWLSIVLSPDSDQVTTGT